MLQKNGSYSLPRGLAKSNQFNWQTLLSMLFYLLFFPPRGYILYSLGYLDIIVVKITLKTEQWQNQWSNNCLRCSVRSQLRDISCSAQIQMLTLLTF